MDEPHNTTLPGFLGTLENDLRQRAGELADQRRREERAIVAIVLLLAVAMLGGATWIAT